MKNSVIPVVSIVGRPNVGKSSLFNRIIKKRKAVVTLTQGTTRDRIEHLMRIKDKSFTLVDTGGFLPREKDQIQVLVKTQIEKTIAASELLLFVCDGESGLLPLDMDLARLLRKSGKNMFLVINKIDNEKKKENLLDFYELGLGEPFGISCLHNLGVEELLDQIIDIIPRHPERELEEERPIKIAIVGRPNVGKSSFLNKVLGEERVIVHEKPGTTRDAIDISFRKEGILFLLIDTPGIRHKRKVKRPVDAYGMMRSRESIKRCDVAFFLIDGMEGITRDDKKIFDYINQMGRGSAMLINKWDLVRNIEMSRYKHAILKSMPEAKKFPILFISAKTGANVANAFNLVKSIKTNLDLFIDASILKDFIKEINPERIAIPKGRPVPRFYNMTQLRLFPKEFLVFVNDPRSVTDFHTAFIENRLRERIPLEGVPLRIMYRKGRGPAPIHDK